MNARQLLKYLLVKDTTFQGEFRLLERLAGPDAPRPFVDLGANAGFYGPNSFPFVARGWRSLLLEPHPGAFAQFPARHAGKANVVCRNVACGQSAGEMELHIDPADSSQSTLTPGSHAHFPPPASRRRRASACRSARGAKFSRRKDLPTWACS